MAELTKTQADALASLKFGEDGGRRYVKGAPGSVALGLLMDELGPDEARRVVFPERADEEGA